MKNYLILLLFTTTLQIVSANTSTNIKPMNINNKNYGSNSYNSLVVGFSLLLVLLNSMACLFIFYRTFMIWRDGIPLTFSLKFPLYLSFIEFCTSILQIISLSSTINIRRPLDLAPCNLIGVMSIFFLSLAINLTMLVSLIIRFSTRKNILIKDEIIMILLSTIFSILYAVMDIGNEKNVNWWCSPINEPIIPFILSIIYFIIFGFFIISLKIQIKNAIQTREFENTPNKSPENNLVDSENESERLQVTEIKKITSYISIIWVQVFVMFIYTITQLARADSMFIGVYYIFGLSISDILILFQYIRYESLIHGQNQSKIPKFVINQAPTKNSNDSPINTTKNWFLGQFHSNKHLTFSSINSSFSSSRESYTSFRDSFRDSIQKFKLPFTKIQVQVVQHQISESSDSYSDSGSDGHIRLEIPTINNNISKNS
ncbi:hypothetical protein C2G38_185834 [Gigaspora rosea]|uniref:G-protein coupled receptors family 1 profile domain-containing protein n=1 Tax=Gigaspora rosea TaxID=44941 RepID=A0A397ULW8_9GLOM|nr:hypothetical protein C2G38_185834 [Gigaspora rosea]